MVVRISFLFLVIFFGLSVVLYFLAWVLIPNENVIITDKSEDNNESSYISNEDNNEINQDEDVKNWVDEVQQ